MGTIDIDLQRSEKRMNRLKTTTTSTKYRQYSKSEELGTKLIGFKFRQIGLDDVDDKEIIE